MSALAKRAQARALRAQADALDAEADALDAAGSGVPPGAVDALVPLTESGLDTKSARKAVREGRLPCARIGRRDFVKRSDVLRLFDDLVAAQRAARTAAPASPAGGYGSIVSLERRRGAA